MSRDEDARELFESAEVEPTAAERAAILAAAEPILAEHAATGRRPPEPPSIAERIRSFLAPRHLAFAAAAAMVVAIVWLGRGTPTFRETRSAPLRSWTEYVNLEPGRAFPLASETFARPY